MLLNVVNSGSAAAAYGARRMVAWRMALPLAAAMLALAPVGAWLNTKVPATFLLVFFSVFTMVAAVLMLSGWRPAQWQRSPIGQTGLGLAGGSILGFAAGLVGRGGGSFVVPLLCMSGMEAKIAAVTSAFIVSCAGVSSFLPHIATAARPRWLLWIACAVCVLVGSQLGSRVMADWLRPRAERLIFGVVLMGVAALILIKDVLLA